MSESLNKMLEIVKEDSTLYAGMLAALGDKDAYEYLSSCVSAGKVFRNPEAADIGENYPNCSSRDMLMGVLVGGANTLAVIQYLSKTKGKLFPDEFASDNRNRIGVIGWGQLYATINKKSFLDTLSTLNVLGAKKYLGHMLFGRLLLGPVLTLEALTVYKPYQLNLVYCALMTYRRLGICSFWDKMTMKVLKDIRLKDDGVFHYLDGNVKKVSELAATAKDNAKSQKSNAYGEVFGWPPGCEPYHFSHIYPSDLYVYWCELALAELKKKN